MLVGKRRNMALKPSASGFRLLLSTAGKENRYLPRLRPKTNTAEQLTCTHLSQHHQSIFKTFPVPNDGLHAAAYKGL